MNRLVRKKLFPRWAMLALLGLLGLTLATLFTLLYLLYWMQAPVGLPDPASALLKDPDFVLQARPSLWRPQELKWTDALLSKVLQGAPDAARTAARYALAPERAADCPMQVVASARAEQGRRRWAAAVSLGKYRGAFWLADRAMSRMIRAGALPYVPMRRGDANCYVRAEGAKGGAPAMCVWRATGIAGDSADTVSAIHDSLAADADRAKGVLVAPKGAMAWGKAARPDAGLPSLLAVFWPKAPDMKEFLAALGPVDYTARVEDDGSLLLEAEAPWRGRAAASQAAAEMKRTFESFEGAGGLEKTEVDAVGQGLRARLWFKAPGKAD
ncbi:MAG TPA: hypothetical protein P5137_08265 [Candidatus Brocadiia bacterium]|nr:hypothetical protein [Candidatus Brocadiia bacterium]